MFPQNPVHASHSTPSTQLWKNLSIAFVLLLSIVYALPNGYPDDPAVQLTGARAEIDVDASVLQQVESELAAAEIDFKAIELQDRALLVRLNSDVDQLKAKRVLQEKMGEAYLAALNLAPTTPDWLKAMGAGPMKLGLDLRGGVHFLMEVDIEDALQQRYAAFVSEFATTLREQRIRYKSLDYLENEDQLQIAFSSQARLDEARQALANALPEFDVQEQESGALFSLMLRLTEAKVTEITNYAISQNLTTIRNRVNELGVAEPLVQRQGLNRIVVELPGVQDTAQAKRVLGRTASLEFRMVDTENSVQTALQRGRAPRGTELFYFKDQSRGAYLLENQTIVKGDNVLNAQSGFDENGQPQVSIDLDGAGGKRMLRTTNKHVGDDMAVLFIENKTKEVDGERVRTVEKYLINVATIQSAFGNSFRITGLDSPFESSELALLLRSGALAAPMYIVEERTIGPSLGQENIQAGLMSVVIGFVLVMVCMCLIYKLFGLFANIALVANLVIVVAIMSLIPGATLTLPGIAGIVLTVGMAVDANVLIFSRIKEEWRRGLSPQDAISAGYDRAFSAIIDANITTLIVALILFAAGTGPVRGFAVTLSIGILTSMFTAIIGTRALVRLWYGEVKQPERLLI